MSVAGREVNGLRIAKARLALLNAGRPMTQAALAQRLGIHWVTMSNIENGKARVSLELLERIAEETGKSRDYFLGDDDEEAEPVAVSPNNDVLEQLYLQLGAALGKQRVA